MADPGDRTDAAPGGRRRRRAVGPAGAPASGSEPRLDLSTEPAPLVGGDEDHGDERLRRDRPPHHDQGV